MGGCSSSIQSTAFLCLWKQWTAPIALLCKSQRTTEYHCLVQKIAAKNIILSCLQQGHLTNSASGKLPALWMLPLTLFFFNQRVSPPSSDRMYQATLVIAARLQQILPQGRLASKLPAECLEAYLPWDSICCSVSKWVKAWTKAQLSVLYCAALYYLLSLSIWYQDD